MKRIIPPVGKNQPCSICALLTALYMESPEDFKKGDWQMLLPEGFHIKTDGYATLNDMNKLVRANMKVKRRVNYKREERPSLETFIAEYPDVKAIVCCYGHFLYVEKGEYYSFFTNDIDPVVTAWFLE